MNQSNLNIDNEFREYYDDNNKTFSLDYNRSMPKWAIVVCFVFLTCGACINVVHTLTLIRCKRNGILFLVLQLAFIDIISLYVSITEIITLDQNTWLFPSDLCPLFRGLEILINCLTLYLIVCVNFHLISLWNLYEWASKKSNKNPLTSYSTSSSNKDDESNECLVTRQELSVNRVVHIDYSKRKNDVSVIFPTILVWFVSLSLSIPNFTLSSTLQINNNYTLCAIIDVYYGTILQYLLLVFRMIIPVILLILSFILLIFKLFRISKEDIENVLTKKFNEIKRLLIFGIFLTIFYLITSSQRQCLHLFQYYSFTSNNNTEFKLPSLLYNNSNNNLSNFSVYFTVLHYSGSIFRGLLYIFAIPKYKYLITNRIFGPCQIENK